MTFFSSAYEQCYFNIFMYYYVIWIRLFFECTTRIPEMLGRFLFLF